MASMTSTQDHVLGTMLKQQGIVNTGVPAWDNSLINTYKCLGCVEWTSCIASAKLPVSVSVMTMVPSLRNLTIAI